MNLLQPERLERLSREYVLGTLTGRARRRFERLLAEAPLATRVVARWQQRFDVLAAGVPPVQPRDQVWQGLQQRLFASREKPAAPSFWARVQALLAPRVLGGALAGVLAATVVLKLQPQWLELESRSEALPQSYVGLLVNDAGQAGAAGQFAPARPQHHREAAAAAHGARGAGGPAVGAAARRGAVPGGPGAGAGLGDASR